MRVKMLLAVVLSLGLVTAFGACGSRDESWGSLESPSQEIIDSFPFDDFHERWQLLRSDRVYHDLGLEIWLAEVSAEDGDGADMLWRCVVQHDSQSWPSTPCYGAEGVVELGIQSSNARTETTTVVVGWVPERLEAPLSIETSPAGIELLHLDDRSFSFEVETGQNALVKATGHNGKEWELDWAPQQDWAEDEIEWDLELSGEDFAGIDS